MSDERQKFEHLLTVSARGYYANFSMSMVVIGINLFMALYGLSVFLETPETQRKGRKRYIAASFVITVLYTLSASLDMAQYFQVLFKSTSPFHWAELMQPDEFHRNWKHMLSLGSAGMFILIGDALLVYRCYVICTEYWWVTILPAFTSVSSLVLLYMASYMKTGSDVPKLSAASTFLTVSTNILVTAFIAFRLIRARKSLAKLMPSADARLYTGVLAILVESAAPLTLFGIVSAALQQFYAYRQPKTPGFYVAGYFFDGIFYAFCALSPHMIIFRVTTGRSFTKFPTARDGVLSNPLQFAHETAESSFLQSTYNRGFGRNSDSDDAERGNSSVSTPEADVVFPINHNQEKGNGSGDVEKAEML